MEYKNKSDVLITERIYRYFEKQEDMSMRKVKVAATQMSCSWNREEVLDKAEKLVRKAAAEGANIILLQELFETPYFCQKQKF